MNDSNMNNLRPTPETEAAMLMLDCDDSCVEIYTRNQDGSLYRGNVCRSDKMADLERERDSAKTLNRSLLDQLEAQAVQIEALRKERDELRDEILAANSSSEMELVQETQAQNIQLLEQVSRLIREKASIREERDQLSRDLSSLLAADCLNGHDAIEGAQNGIAMRDAIKEAHDALVEAADYFRLDGRSVALNLPLTPAALAKLQTFLP